MEVRLSMLERAEALVSERCEAPLNASNVGAQMLWFMGVAADGHDVASQVAIELENLRARLKVMKAVAER